MTIDTVVGKVERIAEGGNLLANLELLQDINTWQTSQEVWQAWQSGAPVEGVNTANLGIYRLVDGEAVFDLLGREGNPFLDSRFREETYHGILNQEFFSPQGEMKEQVLSAIKAKQSVTIKYSGLNIKTEGCGRNYGYIEADNENTAEEKKLLSAVYGTDNPSEGKRVYLLREEVVKARLQERREDFVARACYFYGNLNFSAYDGLIGSYISAVRGVRRLDVAAGDAQNKKVVPKETDKVGKAYTCLLDAENREKALELLQQKPELASGLAGLLAEHYKTLAQP